MISYFGPKYFLYKIKYKINYVQDLKGINYTVAINLLFFSPLAFPILCLFKHDLFLCSIRQDISKETEENNIWLNRLLLFSWWFYIHIKKKQLQSFSLVDTYPDDFRTGIMGWTAKKESNTVSILYGRTKGCLIFHIRCCAVVTDK